MVVASLQGKGLQDLRRFKGVARSGGRQPGLGSPPISHTPPDRATGTRWKVVRRRRATMLSMTELPTTTCRAAGDSRSVLSAMQLVMHDAGHRPADADRSPEESRPGASLRAPAYFEKRRVSAPHRRPLAKSTRGMLTFTSGACFRCASLQRAANIETVPCERLSCHSSARSRHPCLKVISSRAARASLGRA